MSRPKKRTVVENGVGGDESALLTTVQNFEDLGPIVRQAFDAGKSETLIHQLKSVVKKKEVEIEELCKQHYEDFIRAIDELRGVIVEADDLKNGLMSENFRLQEGSSALLLKLEEFLEGHSVKSNIEEAIKMCKLCVLVMELCAKCNFHFSNNRFYPALKTLDLIEKNYLHLIPLKALSSVIEQQIPVMKQHIEKKVISEFNEWLVIIRRTAREIGQKAIGQAASSRQKEEETLGRQLETEEQSRPVADSCVLALDMEDSGETVNLNFDLTPVYRAYHIHTCLGLADKFRNYYCENRMMQLNQDLQISPTQTFLESHHTYFAQIAGFFIVEDRVLRSSSGFLLNSDVELVWDNAVSKITSMLTEQFSRMDTANHFLMIKDYVSLLSITLKKSGYIVKSLLDVLGANRDKYHELLFNDCRKQISDVLSHDSYEQMVIRKESEYNNNVLAFNLQTSDIMPAFPYIAPFSATVPDCCRVVRSFIEDSVNYLSYDGYLEIYDVVRMYLDRLLIEVLNESLLTTICGLTSSVSQAMQVAANLTVFERACDFFIRQAARHCRIPVRSSGRPHGYLSARTVLRKSQDVAHNALLRLVNSKVDDFMSLTENINWSLEDVPQNGNEYISEVIIYLETLLSTAQQILPLDALFQVGSGALKHVSDCIVAAFLSDNMKRFNLSAVMGVDVDLKMLEEFADERFESTGLSQVYTDGNLRDYLMEARQLVNLLLSSQPENFMNPVIREKNYSSLDPKKVSIICEKYRDATDRIFSSLSSRSTQQNARKKSMDVLRKRLKDFT